MLFEQEPAFQELILLYTEEVDETEAMDTSDIPALQLKIYETIPIPELPVNISLPLFILKLVAYLYTCN